MFNPYQPYMQQGQQIIRVNGENGAKTYQMLPNSSALLLDESAPRLFLAQTDGAGYKTISSYKLEPYIEEPAPDLNDLMTRLSKVEDFIYAKSNSANAKRKQQEQE